MNSLMRHATIIAALLAADGAAGAGAAAQAAADASMRAACSYDACAVRLGPNGFLVRGASGEPLTWVRWYAADSLRALVAGIDSAERAVEEYVRHGWRGSFAWFLGHTTLAMAFGFAAANSFEPRGRKERIVGGSAVVAGAIVYTYGEWEGRRAAAALHRAVWWYNRQFASQAP